MAATTTEPDRDKLDSRGVERTRKDDEGPLEKFRDKWPWFDHVMRMQERYSKAGGNQFAAGITYFSVLSLFPLLMLSFAILALVLANNQDLLNRVLERAAQTGEGQMGDILKTIIKQAVDQAGSVFSIGLLLALWSGLTWMSHLRMGASSMWRVPGVAQNLLRGKIKDLIGLIVLIIALIVAFAVTIAGNSGLTSRLLELVGLDAIPGARFLTFLAALVIGLIANYLVFLWLIVYLPRTRVPRKSAARAAVIGAIAFEIFKQFGSLFFSKALSNPAGAAFGPIIGVMVLMYFVWRIVLYCSAWAATTPEALSEVLPEVPPAAVIRVRQEVRTGSTDTAKAGLMGVGAAIGVLAGGLVTGMFRRDK
ncbi:YhjD/YihY/BrkB family envelope integrity protein [Corynebacterium heidelbergense]|uniref:Inner membrane protein YhjD n=1 Tax=Corynebacterium heidelbergense TaxID=2055947 RepID=A0A364VDS5_9CORY|nr:YhjD/YihY/BrkB family envelope integrity protein [Corynebacterium heidelbergense]RAV34790.1 inner membrane protein YhjD [Corynebacterium heidelbergense]WCZ37245.1 Inner membrane protein YhjD [Corynebacterium heidelbergense]